MFGSGASRGPDGVTEKLGIVNWRIDRGENDLTGGFFYFPLSVLTGRLAESWETPDTTTAVFNIRRGVHWHDKAPMNGRELTDGLFGPGASRASIRRQADLALHSHPVPAENPGVPAGALHAGEAARSRRRDGRKYMEQAPWLALWPGLCLTVTVYSLNMFGDAVRDLLDPRLRGGGGRLGTHRARREPKPGRRRGLLRR